MSVAEYNESWLLLSLVPDNPLFVRYYPDALPLALMETRLLKKVSALVYCK